MNANPVSDYRRLPGWEIVAAGIEDLSQQRVTPEACAIWIALPKLRRARLVDERVLTRPIQDAELTLYRLLKQQGGDAYGRYQSMLRRLVRFEHAVEKMSQDAFRQVRRTPDSEDG